MDKFLIINTNKKILKKYKITHITNYLYIFLSTTFNLKIL